jgi:phosphatidate phosphatase APP1
MIEFSRENHKSVGRSSNTANKIIFSTYKKKDDSINYIVFYIGKQLMENMQVGKGDCINVFMDEKTYLITFTIDQSGKTVNIQKSGRGVLTIKWCPGLPYPTGKAVNMINIESESGQITAEMPEVGVSYE